MPWRRGSPLRQLPTIALMPAAALAVHELRYLLAFGTQAGAELQRQGHSYLHSLVPWIVLALALCLGGFVRAVGQAFRGQYSLPRYTLSFSGLWLLCAACLVGVYVCQEFLEGLFASGHPAGLAGIFGFGGWWSIPAALAIGLVVAALLHGGRWVLGEVSQRAGISMCVRRARNLTLRPGVCWAPRPVPLAAGWSGRGPPR